MILRPVITFVCFVTLTVGELAIAYASIALSSQRERKTCAASDECCGSEPALQTCVAGEGASVTRVRGFALTMYRSSPAFTVHCAPRSTTAGIGNTFDRNPDFLADTLRRTHVRHSVWLI